MNFDRVAFGVGLGELRRARKVGMKEVAHAVGMDAKALRDLERGAVVVFLPDVVRLAGYFGLGVEDFMKECNAAAERMREVASD